VSTLTPKLGLYVIEDSDDANAAVKTMHNADVTKLDEAVLLTAAQTLTSKTLTSPTINGGTLDGTFGGTFTLTSPTLASPIITGRVLGDFSNATIANRVLFKTTTVNANTAVGAIPDGTGTAAYVIVYGSSSPDNAAFVQLAGTQAAGHYINSDRLGTGTLQPFDLRMSGGAALRVQTSGGVTLLGTADPGAGQLRIEGNVALTGSIPAWGAGYRTIALNSNIGLTANPAGGGAYVTRNAYWDGSYWRYISADTAEIFQLTGGVHYFLSATSGSAGAQMLGNLATRMLVSNNGTVTVGSASSGSSFMTIGVCVDQGTGGNEVLTLKGTGGVAHGMTNYADSATFLAIYKAGTGGGGMLRGVASGATGVFLQTFCGTDDSSKSTSSAGWVMMDGYKNAPPTIAAPIANQNAFVVKANSLTRFMVDNEGDIYADAGSGTANSGTGYFTYDEHEDAELVRALDVERRAPRLVRSRFDAFLRYGRPALEAARIATFNDGPGGDGSVFVNYSALARLHSGAIWQQHTRTVALAERVAAQAARIDALEARLALQGGS